MSDDNIKPPESENDRIDREQETVRTNQSLTRRFDGVSMTHDNAATQALIAKETATIQARWIMAKQMPRSMHHVRQSILKEIERPGFSKLAIYRVPRGGNTIKGLTIRFAEVAMRCFGNLHCEAQTLFDSPTERVIRVSATDFESNATWSRDITVTKTVERKQLKKGERPIRTRVNSFGDTIYIVDGSDDDIRTKEAAEISKASRTAILRLIPGHIQDEAFDRCDEMFTKNIEGDVDGQKNKMCDAFAREGVMPAELEKYLGHSLDSITAKEITELITVGTAIRNGDTSWAEAFEGRETRTVAKPGDKKPDAAKTTAEPAKSDVGKRTDAHGEPRTTPTSGKGTEAAKAKIKGETAKAAPPATATSSPATSGSGNTVAVMVTPGERVEVKTPDQVAAAKAASEPVPIKPDHEERPCEDCGAIVEVPISDPPGSLCYACASK